MSIVQMIIRSEPGVHLPRTRGNIIGLLLLLKLCESTIILVDK